MIRALILRALVLAAAFAPGLTPVTCLGENSNRLPSKATKELPPELLALLTPRADQAAHQGAEADQPENEGARLGKAHGGGEWWRQMGARLGGVAPADGHHLVRRHRQPAEHPERQGK